MSDLGQWFWDKAGDLITKAVQAQAARTALVVSTSGHAVTVNDPMLGGTDNALLTVFGSMPSVAERVLLFTLMDGERVAMRSAQPNDVLFAGDTQSASLVPNTGATATYQTAFTVNLTLGEGTWRVMAVGLLKLKRSPAGLANVRVVVDGNASTANVFTADLSVFTAGWGANLRTGVSGGRTIAVDVQYHGNSGAGVTTYSEVPLIFIIASRTS